MFPVLAIYHSHVVFSPDILLQKILKPITKLKVFYSDHPYTDQLESLVFFLSRVLFLELHETF